VRGIRGGVAWLGVLVLACQPTISPLPSFAPPPSATASDRSAEPAATPTATPRSTPTPPPEPLWEDVTEAAIGRTAEWTNKVEIADLDGDERPDLLFANGGLYEEPGSPEPARVFRNLGTGRFEEMTEAVFGDERFLSRAIKVGTSTRTVTQTSSSAARTSRQHGCSSATAAVASPRPRISSPTRR
jgi:hypothetical protein